MRKGFPNDVTVLSPGTLLHVRLERVGAGIKPERTRVHRMSPGVFGSGVQTPPLADPEGLRQGILRMKNEAGDFSSVSVLLPDSWFRMNILEIKQLPERPSEADEMVRWTLRRTLPANQDELRIAWQLIEKSSSMNRVLVLGAAESTLEQIESVFAAEQIQVCLIEPVGLNIWNLLSDHEGDDGADRVFFYFRNGEFTTGLFRGAIPLFVRSRALSGERSVIQELKLSASYLRGKAQLNGIKRCWVAGSSLERWIIDAVHDEFRADVEILRLEDLAISPSSIDVEGFDAEIAGCLGVFSS